MKIQFGDVFTFGNLYAAYKKCRRGVGWKHSTQAYKENAFINVRIAQRKLLSGAWKSNGFIEFDIFERGKHRHIRSVHITERVVQRCLCDNLLTPVLGPRLIPDNSASQKGKGVDYALRRLETHLHQFYRKFERDGYILIYDFHKFFDSISHDAIVKILERYIADERLKHLILHLVGMFGSVGLGLGSQISQNLALAVPNRLDHRIKERMHCRFYGRYMDDGYIIHHDKEHLLVCLDVIRREAAAFGVEMNETKTQIIPLRRGFSWLKQKFSLTETGGVVRRISRKNVTRQRRKLKKLAGKVPPEDLRTSFVSWCGHVSKCKSWKTKTAMKGVFWECMQKSAEKFTPLTT